VFFTEKVPIKKVVDHAVFRPAMYRKNLEVQLCRVRTPDGPHFLAYTGWVKNRTAQRTRLFLWIDTR